MNILVLNGSPKGERSNTVKITNAFLDGINTTQENNINLVNISQKKIEHCLGCYICWKKTPGICIIDDDMSELIKMYINSDLIIWSFPLYYFGMPSKIKAFLDRLLPTSLPSINIKENQSCGHPGRYDLSHQMHLLISSCGFYSVKGNYDALFKQFEIMFGKKLSKIICPEGELLNVPELSGRINSYLSDVRAAGKEYFQHKSFSEETLHKLDKLFYPPEIFIKLANMSWELDNTEGGDVSDTDRLELFLRQMAALYDTSMFIKDIVFEMHFTDLNKTYQLLLEKETCTVKTEDFLPYTTRIEIPFTLWLQFSEGKTNGSEYEKDSYKVFGDTEILLKLKSFFSN